MIPEPNIGYKRRRRRTSCTYVQHWRERETREVNKERGEREGGDGGNKES
jgi:hypothetical protein